jgi:hypothetical protein
MNPYLRTLKWILLAGVTATGAILLSALASLSAVNTGGDVSSSYPAAAFDAAGQTGAFTFVVLLFWLTASATTWQRGSTEKASSASPRP